MDKSVKLEDFPNGEDKLEGERLINMEYDIEDCSLLLQKQQESPPPPMETPKQEDTSGLMLEPDHPLLAKFQRALKEQLERQLHKLTEEVAELEIGIKKKSAERDSLGVEVYDAQQMVTLQYQSIEQCENEIRKLTTDREELETELVDVRSKYKEGREKLDQAEKKEMELRDEVETINYMMRQMSDWESKLQSDLAVNQRISDKAKIDKKQFSVEKRNLDFIIYKLMTEVFRLENSLDHLDMQLRVKEQERENFANKIASANADIESLETEHKHLIHSWNCVLVAIGHRDKVYLATKKDLEKEQEILRSTIIEIANLKKLCNEEMNRNEQLTLVKGRIDMDKTNINSKLSYEKDKLNNLEKKLMETQAILSQTAKDLEEIVSEKRLKEQDIDEIRREIEKNVAVKCELEEKILTILQEQMTNDKISKYMNKSIRELREKNRSLEIQLASVENKTADIYVTIEHQKALNEETIRFLDDIVKQENKEEDELNARKNELQAIINEIKKKQISFDILNKKLEECISKAGGVELTPQELKIKDLEKQIAELDEKTGKLKVFWLRQQSYIVSLREQRQKQLNEKNLIRKQTMLLEQKNLKLEDELEELQRQEKVTNRNMSNIKVKLDRLSIEIMKKRGLKESLDTNTCTFRNEVVLKLKDAELECIKLESELSDLEDEKDALSKELLELNREALAWERKVKMALETKQTISKEKGNEGEIGTMRAEIHRMTVRYSQLRKAQEKLVHDLNHCISRREFIFVNAEATEKRLSLGGKVNNRINFKRKLEDMKNKVKKTEHERKFLEKKISQACEIENEMYEQITENNRTIEDLETKIIELSNSILTAKFDRTKELELLVFKQHKLRAFTHITKGQYRALFRTASALESEYCQQNEINTKLQTIVENLILDFPNHYPVFARILNTLKIICMD